MDYENEEYGELVNWLHGIFIQLYCDVINSFAQNYNLSSSLHIVDKKNTQIYIRDNSISDRKNVVAYIVRILFARRGQFA